VWASGSHPPTLRSGFAYTVPMPCSHTSPPDALHVEDRWLTETVLLLARGVAADLGFDRLPILADALEDAGCDNFTLLRHLRADEPHRVECWALRRLLRTTLMLPGGVPITFAYCPPGSYLMGSDHPDARDDERPVHRVTLTRAFYAGIFPVTQKQWRAVLGRDPVALPEGERNDGCPVTWVSWVDAQEWCKRAADNTGRELRLPSEAEWEYACRAGTTTEFHFGDEASGEFMNHQAGFPWGDFAPLPNPDETTQIESYPPNPWGLFDCHGNVFEWCQDLYEPGFYTPHAVTDPLCRESRGHQRVARGGSYARHPAACRSASRWHASLALSHYDRGFRVVFTAT
jgi:formylglycine-generating enzyme required for sulfatase activity